MNVSQNFLTELECDIMLQEISIPFLSKYLEYKKKKREREETLRSNGIDPDIIKNKARDVIDSHKEDLKDSLQRNDKVSFIRQIKEIKQEYVTAVSNMGGINVIKSALLLIVMTLVDYIISYIVTMTAYILLSKFIGQNSAKKLMKKIEMFLSAVIIGPLIEEIAKFYSLKNKFGGEFVLVLNTLEFFSYVSDLLQRGVGIFDAVFNRVLTMLMHLNTVAVQQIFINRGSSMAQTIFVAWIQHALWNFFETIPIYLQKTPEKKI